MPRAAKKHGARQAKPSAGCPLLESLDKIHVASQQNKPTESLLTFDSLSATAQDRLQHLLEGARDSCPINLVMKSQAAITAT